MGALGGAIRVAATVLALAALLVSRSAAASGDPWFRGLDFAATERRLSSSPVTRMRDLGTYLKEEKGVEWHGSNPLRILDLEDGSRGVFRSEDEPWGSMAEVAGYRFSRKLGLSLVPPTVVRTLHREDLPASVAWPWVGPQRPGSVQLFVDSTPGEDGDFRALTAKERADVEVVTFVMGNFDNHSGNLLRDDSGAPVLIDFENALDVQQQRYGDFPFVKRGGRFEGHGRPWLGRGDPFPFDAPEQLVDPSLEEIRTIFGPWWGQYWARGMDLLYALLDGIPGRRVPFVIYQDQLWVQVRVRSRHPAHTDVYSQVTLERLRELDRDTLTSEIYLPPFDERHQRALMDRRRQILGAAEGGLLIR